MAGGLRDVASADRGGAAGAFFTLHYSTVFDQCAARTENAALPNDEIYFVAVKFTLSMRSSADGALKERRQ